MSGYTPLYEITDKILSLFASISEKIGRVTKRSNLDTKPQNH